jgi:hypothetical protein
MSESAIQVQYRQEMIAAYERRRSLLTDTVTTEAMIKGRDATFLVAGSGGSTAVTRGINGRIPTRANDVNQYTATLVEWHDIPTVTGFNIFQSQGDLNGLLQKESMATINRKIDSDIITELNTATVTAGSTATTMSLPLVLRAKAVLQRANVPWDMNVFGLITPAADAYLMQVDAYANADYVDSRVFDGVGNAWADTPKMKQWAGVNWIVHPGLPGDGTSAEKCFMYHKSSIGHAVNVGGMKTVVGYDDEQDYSFARTSIYMGSQILQNSGIVVINHDGSAMVAG